MTALHLAVFGLGSIGLRHAKNALALGQKVTGFDPDPDRRALLSEAGGCVALSREEAIATADAVIVASPNRMHRDDIGFAVSGRRHVFAEKPLAHSDGGMEALLAEAAEKGLVVFAAQNIRYHPAVKAAHRMMVDGRLGEILWSRFVFASYLPGWRAGRDYRSGYANDPEAGGILFDMVHEFDLAAHLIGPFEPVAAAARRSPALELDADSSAALVLKHAGGSFSTLTLDYATRPTYRRIEIAGTVAQVQIDLEARSIAMKDAVSGTIEEDEFPGGYDEDYVDEMKNFLASVAGDEKPLCDGAEAFGILKQVLAAREMAGLRNLR
ncbi:MAG: Gfo/Idh/MocA family oxidoreductase [Pseudomonadota bacterium]|nr:Gfo/Idh/MocA family oxidoreductase [Pseudomonadota bacterium]